MTIRWDEITKNNLTDIEKALEIYDQAFPIDVREPHDVFYKGFNFARERKPNSFRFLVGYEEEQLVSLATGHYFANANLGFIVYIAINPHVRSKGLGSKTLVKLEELLKEDAVSAGNGSLKAVILETEKQEFVHTEEEREECLKRNRFFEKNGYTQFKGLDYIQPPLNKGESSVPLNLFINNNVMSKQEITDFIRVIYLQKYDLVNGIDKRILKDCLERMGID